MSVFEQTVFALAFVGALASVLSVAASVISQRRLKRRILELVEEQKLEAALASDDIEQLGQYLDRSLANVTVFQYSSDLQVSKRIDRYLKRVQEYVGTTEEIEKSADSTQPTATETHRVSTPEPDSVPQDFKPILEEFATGETWNALAQLRRNIEMRLRHLAVSRDLDISRARSAGPLLRVLAKAGLVDQATVKNLEYTLNVSNRAIHGFEVSPGEAEGAIAEALHSLRRLPQED